jgi:hypothetical protein
MLSQRIALYSLRLTDDGSDSGDRVAARRELTEAVALFERSHAGLVSGDAALGLSEPSDAVAAIFFEAPHNLDSKVERYISEARALSVDSHDKLDSTNPHLGYIQNAASMELLVSLDTVVRQLEQESESAVDRLQGVVALSLIVILGVLASEVFVVFRPMIRLITFESHELEGALAEEHRIAYTLQRSLVPSSAPDIDGLQVEFFYQSATKAAAIGGDFYDFYQTPEGGWAIGVGDVEGKGIDAAAETARAKFLLRDRALSGLSPAQVMASVNDALVKQGVERFTALTFSIYNESNSTLVIANAANPYPYLSGPDEFLELTNIPLSLFAGETYAEQQIEMESGDTVIMYSDGLVEARVRGELFGAERLRDYVKSQPELPLSDLLEGLVEEARRFSEDHLADDIVLVGLRKK